MAGKPKKDKTENCIRLRKISGLVLFVFAVFTIISIVSYMISWKSDQSLLGDSGMMSSDVDVKNLGGKLGLKWGYILVARCFGFGSLALAALLFVFSYRIFFRKSTLNLLKTSLLSVSGALLVSFILAYVSEFIGGSQLFGGGLGGDCGSYAVSWAANLISIIPLGLVILLLMIIWALYASDTFARWFSNAGEKKKEKTTKEESVESKVDEAYEAAYADNSPKPLRTIMEEEQADILPADVSAGQEGQDILSSGHELSVSHSGNTLTEEVPDHSSSVPPSDQSAVSDILPAGNHVTSPAESEDVASQQPSELEIVEGDGLDVEIKADLPRIDTREELENFKFFPLDLLSDYASGRHIVSKEEHERNSNKIKATLLNYKIQIEKATAVVGPTVTLYKIIPAPGVKISAIRNLEEDIAMALGAKGVRVVTLSDAVGIEVANDHPSIVPLKSMLNDDSFRNSKYELPVALGYTITQEVKTFDLADAPHLLVAGATKMGKSVGLNVIISSLLYAKHPSELKFVFIDPKMVEFTAYKRLLKHYLAVLPTAANEQDEMESAIVKNIDNAEKILRSLCTEMDDRYLLMSKTSANNIKLYNEKYKDRHLLPTEGHHFMPYLVVVIDEYSDLIMSGSGADSKKTANSIMSSIIRLAQKGRAAGIHVIIATQRPSVNVITGLIKSNFPMRIAFRTSSRMDSTVILDKPGAERLIGKGDLLYWAGMDMERVQCAYISSDEIDSITKFIGNQTGYKEHYNTPFYLPSPDNGLDSDSGGGMVDMQNLDEMFKAAAEMVVINQIGSTSTLQRKLGMGYARAGRVMDQLEAAGIVGPQDGSKPRQVLVPDLATLEGILDAYMNH
ncbi:MAG: DNA translocase FtsK 4TM domain-containing protein [Candidatus Cryptobacteroides sp.]